MYHIFGLHFIVHWAFLQVCIFIFIVFTVVLVPHGPQGQGLKTDPSIPPGRTEGIPALRPLSPCRP